MKVPAPAAADEEKAPSADDAFLILDVSLVAVLYAIPVRAFADDVAVFILFEDNPATIAPADVNLIVAKVNVVSVQVHSSVLLFFEISLSF